MMIQKAVQKMIDNDQNGFDQLFDMYHKKIYFFCIKNGLSVEDSEEIVQEVFVKFWNSRRGIDPNKNVQAYLYTIAQNTIFDEYKKRIKRKAAEDYQLHLLQPTNNTQETVAYNELEELIAKTLRNLPEKRKLVFELSRYKGLSNREIAEQVGITVKTVEAHLTLALQEFRAVFKQAEIIGIAGIMLSIFY
ncbi:RNA polymerase sigma-70 factor [Marinoscillum sp.]|uniref:RNA polymerase sigma-70 factor n=1 Tax=Marinoscillum sp. TaxID=2024838 RepID=UPI003BAC76BA